MQSMKQLSLGQQVSSKISLWTSILIASVITAVFIVSFILSQQMFLRQIQIWETIAPQQILTNLVDSDHFAIEKEVEFLKSTGLFSSVIVFDNKKKIIAHFGNKKYLERDLIAIKDDAKVIWGHYFFKPDFLHFISPFLFASAVFFLLIMAVYFLIRWRIKKSLDLEFERFSHFLTEVENVTQRLHEITNQDVGAELDFNSLHSSEQIIINQAISKLLDEIRKSNQSLREAVTESEKRKFKEELTQTALQVVHDIASPLAVLNMIQHDADVLPEQTRRMIRNTMNRIQDISNTLLKKARKDFSENMNLISQSLYSLIEQVVTEKRVQFEGRVEIIFDFEKTDYKIFSLIRPAELHRILSNLINNSVEAVRSDNRIIISLVDLGSKALIQIKDFGKGMSATVLNQVGEMGKSFGKTQGTGVGLNHAFETIKEWQGHLQIDSQENTGTTVSICLSKSESPTWFASEINLKTIRTVVVIDDDHAIHEIWKSRLSRIELKLIHFHSPQQFIEMHESNKQSVLYLCDYEFIGSDINGIELIKKFGLQESSILVTYSMSDSVQKYCEAEKISLLPKILANVVDLKVS